ncbi:N2227-like protein-domain-containing protein [Cokeromyces recurvatus]|uniref:N2227-like protein-domain-containing protein n=1 Tax=Cokeromyces recurvatus TaxID=90255 RepID=UPI0022205FD6|nr:N2227-like protein-domain-containing protein [Cokeromyces recurvatus]KAI7902947.1 N2227-like protein-domain-containing protein [Cokeromyces recurvatus]
MEHQHNHDHHQHDHFHEVEDPIESEKLHLIKVITALAYYKRHSLNHNHKKRRDYLALPEHHKQLIPNYLQKVNEVDVCIEQNMIFLREIVKSATMFVDAPLTSIQNTQQQLNGRPPVSPMDMDKVRSTLKQFVRDWSKEGEKERKATYEPIIKELNEIYKDTSFEEKGKIRILVPGAGLGRLAFDIAKAGFSCQGNEFSYYMLFASNFILNRIKEENQYKIYPFIHSFSNIKSDAQQLSPILIPDVLPANLPPSVDFSMVAGDFIEVYQGVQQENAWDSIVTCFFIDTAKDIIEYMEVIYKALKDNGTWINIGPLLYHFEDSSSGDSSIELSLDQVKEVAKKLGFEFKKESTISTTYTSNPEGMLKYVYECAFWTAVKIK